MADNVSITTGTNATVATDDVAGVHYQIVKISTGPLDSAGAPVSVSNPMPIVGAYSESSTNNGSTTGLFVLGVNNNSGEIQNSTNQGYTPIATDERGYVYATNRYDFKNLTVYPTGLTIATTAYTAGDAVGGLMELSGAARTISGYGMIRGVILTSAADIIGAYDVVYSRNIIPSLAADNAAFNISTDSHANNIIGIVQLAGSYDLGANRIAQASNIAIPYDTESGSSLYAVLITRVGHTFFGAQGDLKLTTYVERY